jgi:exoribonuclease R
MFTLNVANRDYTEWVYINTLTLDQAPHASTLSPLENKLYHGDQVDETGKLLYSPYRTNDSICGVLLSSQKTYGRSNSGNKLLYKCVPDDPHLPCFLVPYEEKHIGFNKTRTDKYISFRIVEWTEKHPRGLLTNTFGEVEDKAAYLLYQMACKNLDTSLKIFTAATLRSLREKSNNPIPLYCEGKAIEDRRELRIISIDPVGCQDIDDAIGIRKLPDGQTILSIYIANVAMMLEYLNLWPAMSDRISTIYLPDKKIPMLPTALSDNMFSLKEKEDRVAFVLDLSIKHMVVQEVSYTSAIIRVEKNYAYDSAELLGREDYKTLKTLIKELNRKQAYVDDIMTSHDVVEYCMLRMNHECAKILAATKRGIFRTASKKPFTAFNNIRPELKHILQSAAGEYCNYANKKPHELIGLESYIHVTSPIRRIVDILNMFELLQDRFPWSADSKDFYTKWYAQLPVINQKTKAIRKLQNEMELLNVYEKKKEQTYTGFVFTPTEVLVNGLILYKYKAYISELKLLTSVITPKTVNNYAAVNFSVHLFLDEAKMCKKIRLELL